MTPLAPHLSGFLCEYLPRERRASPHTCDTYAYAFQLLVCFAADRLKMQPSSLQIEQLDAPLILDFLHYLEAERQCGPKTRNARLAAINALFRYLEFRLVSCLDQARSIHAIPMKKADDKLVDYLTRAELQAILDAPELRSATGLRDRAMLHLAYAAGLRVSELVGLYLQDLELRAPATIRVQGKGRRERVLPLWKETTAALRAWLAVRDRALGPELFLNSRGQSLSRAGFEYILSKYVKVAAVREPSLLKKRISPHVLRHTCAMHTLQATHDVRKVSLWLGHATLQSTEVYLRADPAERLETLEAMTPPSIKRGRFRAPDKLLAMLSSTSAARRDSYAK
jgi:site-specific recombinase XerD